jgi:hypothetical protein
MLDMESFVAEALDLKSLAAEPWEADMLIMPGDGEDERIDRVRDRRQVIDGEELMCREVGVPLVADPVREVPRSGLLCAETIP